MLMMGDGGEREEAAALQAAMLSHPCNKRGSTDGNLNALRGGAGGEGGFGGGKGGREAAALQAAMLSHPCNTSQYKSNSNGNFNALGLYILGFSCALGAPQQCTKSTAFGYLVLSDYSCQKNDMQ